MSERPIEIPGPDHPITVHHNPNRVIVRMAGRVIADTRAALTLEEAGTRLSSISREGMCR